MWNIIFYETENGANPIRDFLNNLPTRHLVQALHHIDILEKYGTILKMPHVKHLQGELRELRVKSGSDISRVIYFVPINNDIVLLHAFIRKTPKTPPQELATAIAYLTDYTRRISYDDL